jgi:hypothetical protein
MSEPYVVVIKDKSHDYKNAAGKRGDVILKQTYFKVVEKTKDGTVKASAMSREDVKEMVKKITSKFKDKSFTVSVFYENKGWLSVPRERFNGGNNPKFHSDVYGNEDEYGEITDYIIYSYPMIKEVV